MEVVATEHAPAAVGPYVQAYKCNGMLYCSGQIGLNPKTMQFADETVEGQAKQVFANLREVLKAAGTTMQKVVKTTCMLKNIGDFATFNAIYEKEFEGHKPARSCYEVSALPKGALVEVELIALL